jgi:hypothetical protein
MHFMELLPHAPICRWVSAQNQQLTLAFNFTGDLHRFRDQVKHLLVDRLALGGSKQ